MYKNQGSHSAPLIFYPQKVILIIERAAGFMNSKEKIIEKYIGLVLKRKTADIPVTEICEEVGICRKTFYRHFRDRYAIIEDIFVNDIEVPLRVSLRINAGNDYYVQMIYQSFLEKKEFYIIAIKEEGNNSLFENIISRLVELNHEELPQIGWSGTELEYLSYKFASTQAFLLRKWIRGGMKESPEFMSKIYLTNLPGRKELQNI